MTYSLSWMADVLKDAKQKVAEQPGWKTRGRSDVGDIEIIYLVIIQLADYRGTCRRSEPSPMDEAVATLWQAHWQTWGWAAMALGMLWLQAGQTMLDMGRGLDAPKATRRA